jgi:hypothetical protein
MVSFISSERWRMTDSPSDFPLPRTRRSALSPAARALRLQRIFARLQDGAAYAEIAAEEGFSRERLRQIIRAATTPGRGHDGPDHKRMQIARLTPALRLAADGVAQGDTKSISLLLKIIDRLDRYSDPHPDFNSFSVLMARRHPRSSRRGKAARTKPACAGDAIGRSAAARPDCPLPAEQALENAQNGKGLAIG